MATPISTQVEQDHLVHHDHVHDDDHQESFVSKYVFRDRKSVV